MRTRWISSDSRDAYELIVVDGTIQDVSKELFCAILERNGGVCVECVKEIEDILRLRLKASGYKKVFVENRLNRRIVKVAFGNDLILPVGLFSLCASKIRFFDPDAFNSGFGQRLLCECAPDETSEIWFKCLGEFKSRVSTVYGRKKDNALVPDWVYRRASELIGRIDKESFSVKEIVVALCDKKKFDKRIKKIDVSLEQCLEVVLVLILEMAKNLHISISVNQENIVRSVFTDKDNVAGHLNCIVDFILWCIRSSSLGIDVRDLVRGFIIDMFDICERTDPVVRDKIYGRNYVWRGHAPVDMLLHFKDSESLAIFGSQPMEMSAQALGVAGLRQSMENRFREILGLNGTNAHLHHDCIPKIMVSHERDLRFSNRSSTAMACLWAIYEWSNSVVHTTVTDKIWVVWKAFDYVGNLFYPSDKGMKGGTFSIHSAVHTKVSTIYQMRESLRTVVRNEECRKNDGLDLVWFQWGRPCAVVDDGYGCDCVINEIIGTGASNARARRKLERESATK